MELVAEVLIQIHTPVIRIREEDELGWILARIHSGRRRKGELSLHRAHSVFADGGAEQRDSRRVEGAGDAEVWHGEKWRRRLLAGNGGSTSGRIVRDEIERQGVRERVIEKQQCASAEQETSASDSVISRAHI